MRYVEGVRLKRLSIKAVLAFVIGAVLLTFVTYIGASQVFAADNIITVTTTLDEDANPGTGCSLYEAVIASNTNSAYGGCEAGSAVDKDIIYLPAGIYSRDADSRPSEDNYLEISKANLVGADRESTFIDGYRINLYSDTATSIENITITTRVSLGYNTVLEITGSNKSIAELNITNASLSYATYIRFTTSSDQVIQNISLDNVNFTSESGVSNPASYIQCVGTGTCSDLSLFNVDIASNFSSSIDLNQVENVSLVDSSVHTIVNGPSTVLLGDNSHLSNVEVSSGAMASISAGKDSTVEDVEVLSNSTGSSLFSAADGSEVDGLAQESEGYIGFSLSGGSGSFKSLRNITHTGLGTNAYSTLIAPAEIIDGYTVEDVNWFRLENSYEGSVIKNVVARAALNTSTVTMKASEITNVSLVSDVDMVLENEYDNAIVNGLTIASEGDVASTTPSVEFYGDNLRIDDLQVIRLDDSNIGDFGVMYFYGKNPTISNLKTVNISVDFKDSEVISLENFSMYGPNSLSAIYSSGDIDSVVFRKGYIEAARDGIHIYGNTNPGATALFEDIQLDYIGVSGNTTGDGGISVRDIDEVTVRNITAYGAVQEYGGPIHIHNGKNHSISNVTILDSAAGLFIASDSDEEMNVAINNVTVYNNQDDAQFDSHLFDSSLFFSVDDTKTGTINATISNSVFGGSGVQTECIALEGGDNILDTSDGRVIINSSYSYSNISSCTDKGLVYLDNFGLASTLSTTSDADGDIGYLGEFGALQTLALESSSPLIGAGDPELCELTDARGGIRLLEEGCDVGAYQFAIQSSNPPVDDDDDDGGDDDGPGENGGGGGDNKDGGNNNNHNTGNNSGPGNIPDDNDRDLAVNTPDQDEHTTVDNSGSDNNESPQTGSSGVSENDNCNNCDNNSSVSLGSIMTIGAISVGVLAAIAAAIRLLSRKRA